MWDYFVVFALGKNPYLRRLLWSYGHETPSTHRPMQYVVSLLHVERANPPPLLWCQSTCPIESTHTYVQYESTTDIFITSHLTCSMWQYRTSWEDYLNLPSMVGLSIPLMLLSGIIPPGSRLRKEKKQKKPWNPESSVSNTCPSKVLLLIWPLLIQIALWFGYRDFSLYFILKRQRFLNSSLFEYTQFVWETNLYTIEKP
jgi:hypothetical protein